MEDASLLRQTECKICKTQLILVKHEYVCPGCGTASGLRVEPTLQQNVPFSQKQSYSVQNLTKEDSQKRVREIKDVAQMKIRLVPQLRDCLDTTLEQIEGCVGKIVDRCFSEEVKRDFPLPRDAETIACSCILIALSNMRQYQGSIQTWQVVDPRDKMAVKRVGRLKDRIERSETVKLFDCGILTEALEVDRLRSIITRLCNQIDLPYKLTVKLTDRFMQITRTSLMDGKNTFYLAAAIIIHSLEGGCQNFPKLPEPSITEDQIDHLCATLNLKKKSLILYTKQLKKQCCSLPISSSSSSSLDAAPLAPSSSSPPQKKRVKR
jgi:uncharacterized Zn finger protein (UPF0148 family)